MIRSPVFTEIRPEVCCVEHWCPQLEDSLLWDLLWQLPAGLPMFFSLSSIQFPAPFPPSGSPFLPNIFACVVVLPLYVTIDKIMFKLPGVGTTDTTGVMKTYFSFPKHSWFYEQ